MAQYPDLKKGNCLEWYTELPYIYHSRKSKTFLFQNIECYFHFQKHNTRTSNKYYLTLTTEGTAPAPKLENLSFTIYMLYSNTYIRMKSKFYKLGDYFMEFDESFFANLSPNHAKDGIAITFVFVFENNIGLFFLSEKKTDEKSVQTPSYIDSCFRIEGAKQDFSKLLDKGPFHDVEFVFADQNIKAHKNVLCCRSDVFASMLQTDMVESKTSRVNIQDMDATIFQQFLRCLYTDIFPELTFDSALQFYEASDKYNVTTLKKQCADYLTDNVSPENACDILIVADQHNDPDFKKGIVEYMMEKKIPYDGEKWPGFCKQNPVLANEVLNLFCQHLRPK